MWRGDSNNATSRRIRVNLSDCENNLLLFSLLRIIVADADDLHDFSTQATTTGSLFRYSRNPVPNMTSSRNETRALQQLDSMCDDYLGRYQHSLAQDLALLASDVLPLYSNHRNAVIQIKGEKEILHVLKRLVAAGLRLLESPSHAAVRATLGSIRKDEHVYVGQYCETLGLRIWRREHEILETAVDTVD
jgi:hypothetical protein